MNSQANNEIIWQTPSARLAKGSGSTNIISLNSIKAAAGVRWEKMREGIASRLEAILRLRLGPSDFFVPIDQSSYLVVMPLATPEEGQICCLRISYELHTSLLGSCGIEQLDIARAEAVGDDVLELRPFSRVELAELAEKADLFRAPPGGGGLGSSISDLLEPQTSPTFALPVDFEIEFLPVWDAEFEVIRAYRCIQKHSVLDSILMSRQAAASELVQVTLAMLARTSAVLKSHLAHKGRFMVNLPISYAALTSPVARLEFTDACRNLPFNLRPYLLFKIEDMPVGVPHSRLVDLVATIAPYCRAVIAKAPRQEASLDIYRGTGLKALGMEVKSATFPQATAAIERLCCLTEQAGWHAFLDDVPNVATLRFALDAGVKWVSGAAVIGPVAEPGPLMHLRLDTLLNDAAA